MMAARASAESGSGSSSVTVAQRRNGTILAVVPSSHRGHDHASVDPVSSLSRVELVRLMMQTMHELGYSTSAQHLQEESGVSWKPPAIEELTRLILAGRFENASALMRTLPLDPLHILAALDDVAEHQFLEHMVAALDAGDLPIDAIELIQAHLACTEDLVDAFDQDVHAARVERFGLLASLVLHVNSDSLRAETHFDQPIASARRDLARRLEEYVPAGVVVPPHRMTHLLNQALAHEIESCPRHMTDVDQLSLLSPHTCPPWHKNPVACLSHEDEVLFAAWSHSGTRLATLSKSGEVRLFDARYDDPHASPTTTDNGNGSTSRTATSLLSFPFRLVPAAAYTDLPSAPWHCAWSPDDRLLAACTAQGDLFVFDTRTHAQLLHRASEHLEPPSSVFFALGATALLTAAPDRKMMLRNMQGQLLHAWNADVVQDFTVSSDGNFAILALGNRRFEIHNLVTRTCISSVQEQNYITSISLSPDDRWLLVSVSTPAQLHLWEVGLDALVRGDGAASSSNGGAASPGASSSGSPARSSSPTLSMSSSNSSTARYRTPRLIHSFTGFTQSRLVLRPSFIGATSSFVTTGSEDGGVFVFDRVRGDLVTRLDGHAGPVNAIAWTSLRCSSNSNSDNSSEGGSSAGTGSTASNESSTASSSAASTASGGSCWNVLASASDDGNVLLWTTDTATVRVAASGPGSGSSWQKA